MADAAGGGDGGAGGNAARDAKRRCVGMAYDVATMAANKATLDAQTSYAMDNLQSQITALEELAKQQRAWAVTLEKYRTAFHFPEEGAGVTHRESDAMTQAERCTQALQDYIDAEKRVHEDQLHAAVEEASRCECLGSGQKIPGKPWELVPCGHGPLTKECAEKCKASGLCPLRGCNVPVTDARQSRLLTSVEVRQEHAQKLMLLQVTARPKSGAAGGSGS